MQLLEAAAHFERTMAGYEHFWCVAGGWALDFHHNRLTRAHEDLEVVVLRQDLAAGYPHFLKRNPHKIVTGDGEPKFVPWGGEPIDAEVTQIRLSPIACSDGEREFDLLLTPSEGNNWIYKRDQRIRRPFSDVVLRAKADIPILAPEIVLFFKAKHLRPKDAVDFENTLPTLSAAARAWLKTSLETAHSGHDWIAKL